MLPEVEECLNVWFCSKRSLNILINDKVLVEKCKIFCEFYSVEEKYKKKIEEFKYSDGWLAKFKLRFNIKNYNIHGESGDVEVADLTKQRNDLIDLTSQYDIKDI